MEAFSNVLKSHEKLQARINHSVEFLADVRSAMTEYDCGRIDRLCIFAAGSLGRFETGRQSDIDLFFIAHSDSPSTSARTISRLEEIRIFSDLIRLTEALKLPEYSGDGRFLKIHTLNDLIEATGDSSRDDSENLFTTRLLLLLESKPLSNDNLYQQAICRVLDNYLRDEKGHRDFVPLFLLNDILRYWRTLCLNYERDRSLAKPWWKKNLNLKFSRLLTVYSTVLAIVAEHLKTTDDFRAFIELVPLQKLAVTLDRMGDHSLLAGFSEILDDYESFLAAKSYRELELRDNDTIEALRAKAEHFAKFFTAALRSKTLNLDLVRYVLI